MRNEDIDAPRPPLPMSMMLRRQFDDREAMPLLWDSELVGFALVQAFVTLDRLPRFRGPNRPGGHWPRSMTEWVSQLTNSDSDIRETPSMRDPPPSASAITKMEECFEWLNELRSQDAGMGLVATLWALRTARGRSIKKLCVEKQWAPHTFFRRRAKALAIVAQTLNGRGVPVF